MILLLSNPFTFQLFYFSESNHAVFVQLAGCEKYVSMFMGRCVCVCVCICVCACVCVCALCLCSLLVVKSMFQCLWGAERSRKRPRGKSICCITTHSSPTFAVSTILSKRILELPKKALLPHESLKCSHICQSELVRLFEYGL